ncbi:MAG: radical SAM protein, partial [Lachnospiraceae bacterium]
EIKKQLEMTGLVENTDFIMYQQFITEWYYRFRNEINLIKTDLILTSRCNLNCKNCMEFLPYWKKRHETSLDECKENLDYYFQCVNYVMEMDLIGGEPFLYSQLPELITYIGERYRDRIGYLGFITNGLLIPEGKVLYLIKKYDITISISDYSKTLHYEERIHLLCKKLDEMGISYFVNENIDWFDFGFPRDIYHYTGDEAKKHMELCNTIEHLLDDKKLYYCGPAWAAQKGGLFPEDENNYIDLCELIGKSSEERKEILEMVLGNIKGGHVHFCEVCGGFGIDNMNKVATAEQYKKC